RFQALAVLERALQIDDTRQDVRRKAAKLALDFNQYAEAREYLSALQQATPDDAELEHLRGLCEELDGHHDEAAKWLDRAIEHGPERVEVYLLRAAMLRRSQDRPTEAATKADHLI